MKKPHFYKAHSRLGMVYVPINGTELNLGVEDGPNAVLSADFLKKFSHASLTEFMFTLPENMGSKDYHKLIAEESLDFVKKINSTLASDETQVVIGGDHSIAFASLFATLSREGEGEVGYIQFDSHGDLHLFKTSPTGNFHGMWLRPFVGDFDSPKISEAAKHKLRADQVLFIGNLELEPEELRFFAENNIAQLSSKHLQDDRGQALSEIKQFISRFRHLHISFDIDVFHKDHVSATGTPAANGLEPEAVFAVLQLLKTAPSISVDLVEVNPRKDKADDTVKMAQRVLLEICS